MDAEITLIRALVNTLELEVLELTGSELEYPDEPVDFHEKVQDYESKLIRIALIQSGGNQAKAAKQLNLKLTTLNTKIKSRGINVMRLA